MVAPEATVEMTVFKGVIEVVVRVAATRIMSDPVVVMVNVRLGGVTRHVGSTVLDATLVRRHSGLSRTVGRDVSASETVASRGTTAAASSSALAESWMRDDEHQGKRSKDPVHRSSVHSSRERTLRELS
jgi:hypothetical protein